MGYCGAARGRTAAEASPLARGRLVRALLLVTVVVGDCCDTAAALYDAPDRVPDTLLWKRNLDSYMFGCLFMAVRFYVGVIYSIQTRYGDKEPCNNSSRGTN